MNLIHLFNSLIESFILFLSSLFMIAHGFFPSLCPNITTYCISHFDKKSK